MAKSSVLPPPGRKPGGQSLSSAVFPNSSDPEVPCSHGHGRQPLEESETNRNIIVYQICVIADETMLGVWFVFSYAGLFKKKKCKLLAAQLFQFLASLHRIGVVQSAVFATVAAQCIILTTRVSLKGCSRRTVCVLVPPSKDKWIALGLLPLRLYRSQTGALSVRWSRFLLRIDGKIRRVTAPLCAWNQIVATVKSRGADRRLVQTEVQLTFKCQQCFAGVMCHICFQQINKTMAPKQKRRKLIIARGIIIYMTKVDGKSFRVVGMCLI